MSTELYALAAFSVIITLSAVYSAGVANGRLEEIELYRRKTGNL